jgi:4-amino-4-deoxy-L-arabinose transferase-like glycosyltransferase
VGLGFETKMGAVLVVMPGLALAWLWLAPNGRLRAVGELMAAGVAAAIVGLAWPLSMALTSPRDRPWISGTADNSIWSLITNYNGLGRVAGQVGGPGLFTAPQAAWVFGGAPGPLRLLNESLGLQAGWFAGLAVAGAAAIAIACRMHRRDGRSSWLIAVGGVFLAAAVVFSAAKGIFHPYYVSLLAPFIAALVGAGVVQVVRSGGVARVLAPVALAAGVAAEVAVIDQNQTQPAWLVPMLVAGALVLGVLLVAFADVRVRALLVTLALVGLLAAPAVAAVDTLGHRTSGTFPAGGPTGVVVSPLRPSTSTKLRLRRRLDRLELAAVLSYIRTHGGGVLGVRSQTQAAEAIVAGNARIAGLGGWSGEETPMSPSWFGWAVRRHRVRWVMYNGKLRVIPGRRIGVTMLLRTVAATCHRVPPAAYTGRVRIARGALYDCRGHSQALERAARPF